MFDKKEYDRQYYENHHEKKIEQARQWDKDNSEWVICPDCGRGRWVRLVKGKPRSIKCYSCTIKIKGKNNPMWNGGIIKNSRGYILIWQGERKYKKRSRLIMEKYLGRKLTSDEIVHHVNEIKDDDRIENLKLVENNSQHLILYHCGGE